MSDINIAKRYINELKNVQAITLKGLKAILEYYGKDEFSLHKLEKKIRKNLIRSQLIEIFGILKELSKSTPNLNKIMGIKKIIQELIKLEGKNLPPYYEVSPVFKEIVINYDILQKQLKHNHNPYRKKILEKARSHLKTNK